MRRLVLSMLCAALAVGFPVASYAQAYPSKPIRFIVPFAPGGGNDILGRVIAVKLHESFGVSVVVDNRGGAGGTIGTDILAKSPPDGYTVLINNVSLAVNVTLYPKLPYDTLKDLEPVSLVGRQPNILVVHPSLPAKTVKDLIALARAKPGQLTYGSGGIGSSSHLSAELLKLIAKVDLVHVPYKGMGPALVDLVAGQTQLCMATMASALPHVKSGRIRALAVSTAQRVSVVPDVPTMIEAGIRDFDYSTWYGIVVPAGTPQPVIARLHGELVKVLATQDVKEKFNAQGVDPASTTPQEFRAYLKSEVDKWAKVVKASGMKVN
ncbi:MAG: tripartite tricarboxylate transporter substrate binding protein [Betaproteobacteria bacterium]|nr:tripartite tricarboxylate transporter substrate binding protein [Betaproteobacteria bacterium]